MKLHIAAEKTERPPIAKPTATELPGSIAYSIAQTLDTINGLTGNKEICHAVIAVAQEGGARH